MLEDCQNTNLTRSFQIKEIWLPDNYPREICQKYVKDLGFCNIVPVDNIYKYFTMFIYLLYLFYFSGKLCLYFNSGVDSKQHVLHAIREQLQFLEFFNFIFQTSLFYLNLKERIKNKQMIILFKMTICQTYINYNDQVLKPNAIINSFAFNLFCTRHIHISVPKGF